VLADIVCHSQFAEAELAREKNVVGEEIRAAEDSPDDRVSEMLAAQVWGDHGLGRPILGTLATLEALTPKELVAYFRRRYRAESLVVAAAGGLEHQRLVDLVAEQFEPPSDPSQPLSGAPPVYAPSARMETREDIQQLYLSLATRGLAFGDPARYRLAVLSALLGGGMSSRLFQSVREEAGLAPAYRSYRDDEREYYRDYAPEYPDDHPYRDEEPLPPAVPDGDRY